MPDLDATLREARELAANGQFQEALELHRWFHENAAILDPAFTGVRTSFALSRWADLEKQYPPALEALLRVRDREANALLSGLYEEASFRDLEAINHWLEDYDHTAVIFGRLSEENRAFAERCFPNALKALARSGNHSLARGFLVDPVGTLESIQNFYRHAFERLGPQPEDIVEIQDGIMIGELAEVLSIFIVTGEIEEARSLYAHTCGLPPRVHLHATLRDEITRLNGTRLPLP